jgi:membrane protein YdbS with pleckstrin-like domain
MADPSQPRPSFGALIHGDDAPTEIVAPARSGPGPALAGRGQTGATGRIQNPDAGGPDPVIAAPEKVVARFRPHGRRLFFPTVFVLVVAGATGYFSAWFQEEWQNWSVLAAGALLAVLFFFVPLVRWLSTRYVITTRRIIFRHGLVVNTRSELMLMRAHDITVRRSLFQAMFRTGDVRLSTGPGELAVLKDVPRADLVMSVLGDLMESQHVPMHAVNFQRPS